MLKEVTSAVDFVSSILRTKKVEPDELESFRQALQVLLCTHYADHWFPEKPFKGSAYRCIRIVNKQMDPIITKAGAKVGISQESLLNMLPSELTIWVDPKEVSYRIGEDGSIGVLFGEEEVDVPAPSPPRKVVIKTPPPTVSAPSRVSPPHIARSSPPHIARSSPPHIARSSPPHIARSSPPHIARYSPPHHPHQLADHHHTPQVPFSQGCKGSAAFGSHYFPNSASMADNTYSWEFLSSTFVAS